MRYQIKAENLLYKMHILPLSSLECKSSKLALILLRSAKIENSFKHLLLECECVVALPTGDKLSRIRPQSVNMLIYKLSPYVLNFSVMYDRTLMKKSPQCNFLHGT